MTLCGQSVHDGCSEPVGRIQHQQRLLGNYHCVLVTLIALCSGSCRCDCLYDDNTSVVNWNGELVINILVVDNL